MKPVEVIKSISYNQHEILRNILDLHCGGNGPDVDITYSVGNFYGKFKHTIKEVRDDGSVVEKQEEFEIPQPKYKFDVDPQVDGCEKIEPWGNIPLDDNSVNVVVVDLPFVIGPRDCPSMRNKKPGSNVIGKRFSSYYPRHEMFESYEHWLSECYRILKPGGVLIWKSQPVISGGINLMTSYYSCRVAEDLGFYIKDEFVLIAIQRLLSGKVKNQMHSRRYHSFFHVFVKDDPKREKTNYWKREFVEKYNKEMEEKNKESVETTPIVNING